MMPCDEIHIKSIGTHMLNFEYWQAQMESLYDHEYIANPRPVVIQIF